MRIRIKAAIAAAVAVVSAGTVMTTANAETRVTEGCPGTMVFGVGGRADPDAAFYKDIPLPAGFALQRVHYSAEFFPVTGLKSYDDSIAEGIGNLSRDVYDFHGRCGGSHILITGYSMGARVAGDTLHNIGVENKIPKNQVDGVLYADPRRVGPNGTPGGIEGNIPTPIKGITMNGPRGFAGIPVHEICNQNDGACLSANPFTNFLQFANGIQGAVAAGAHNYPQPNPVADRGNFDTVRPQAPVIQYGPPLPVQIPTPWELFNGKIPGTQGQAAIQQFRDRLGTVLSPEAEKKLDEVPFLGMA
ncbi:cutinase family protein [Sciscionella sediminilitoris]|uniref:cutinase family protein n=1 Tax=Sciscionella sediminilitoris TaxID=1445613 RepID=UPI0006911E75|nr:PE-PPE domain-containing protein [Sciscionella sp. SE31]